MYAVEGLKKIRHTIELINNDVLEKFREVCSALFKNSSFVCLENSEHSLY